MVNPLWNSWNLLSEEGRQRWIFDKNKALDVLKTSDEQVLLDELDKQFIYYKFSNPNTSDKVLHSKKITFNNKHKSESASESYEQGLAYFSELQQKDGNWAGDYGGPNFLLPGLVFVLYACQEMPTPEKQVLMRRYILNHQNDDGGWGLHIEDTSTMFGTVLNAVSLVLLGCSVDDERISKAFSWIHQHGGAHTIPPWGKMYLAILGLYKWDGLDAMLPEMWLLPKKLPIYPGNYWNHARMVYLPMSYLSGVRFVAKEDSVLQKIQHALYPKGMDDVQWKKARRACCMKDDYYPETKIYKFIAPILNTYNRFPLTFIRKKALKNCERRMHMEDKHTNYINLGPVNKVLNLLCVYISEGKSENFYKHVNRIDDYLWLSEDGMKMNGYNGSQFWDTIFMSHLLLEKNEFSKKELKILAGVEAFLSFSLVRENEEEFKKFDRSISKGGWPFSTSAHGWPITDCTSEGIKAVLYLNKKVGLKDVNLISALKDSVELILQYQNKDGGWASYEKTRAPKWLEKLNPSRIFGEIMIDYSYTECTSACLQAIHAFYSSAETQIPNFIQEKIKKGLKFIYSKQTDSGLWYGSWAVCFTYGTWFAVEAITQCEGVFYQKNDPTNCITKACDGLVAYQNSDGSWGESYLSCVEKKYVPHQEGQVINTAWAVMTLLAAKYDDKLCIEKGIQFIIKAQLENGDWPQQAISGVFNHNCMISYTNYRNIFPLWALQRYLRITED